MSLSNNEHAIVKLASANIITAFVDRFQRLPSGAEIAAMADLAATAIFRQIRSRATLQ